MLKKHSFRVIPFKSFKKLRVSRKDLVFHPKVFFSVRIRCKLCGLSVYTEIKKIIDKIAFAFAQLIEDLLAFSCLAIGVSMTAKQMHFR